MTALLYSLIIASTLTIFALLFLKQRQYSRASEQKSLVAMFFSLWLVSAVFFRTEFYILPAPFFFDLSIERLLFFIIILFTIVGFIKGIQYKLFTNYSFEILMGIFITICVISMMQHSFFSDRPEHPSPWFVFITGYFFPFIVFYFAKYYLSSPVNIRLIFISIFCIAFYLAITAFFEFYGLYQFVYPKYIANPDLFLHFGQARGPFLNSAPLGVAILFGLACGLHLLSYKKGLGKLPFFIFFIIAPPAIFFTQTRAVYLAFIAILLIFLIFYRTNFPKWKVVALPTIISLLIVIAMVPRFAQEDRRAGGVADVETISIRQGLVEASYLMIKDKPLTGVGLAQFVPVTNEQYRGRVPILDRYQDQIYFHNHLLGMTTELGFIGVLVYVSIIILMFKRLFALSQHLSHSRKFININFLVVVTSIWIAFLVNYNFSSPEYQIFPNSVIFLFAGVVDGLYQRHERLQPVPASHLNPEWPRYQEAPA